MIRRLLTVACGCLMLLAGSARAEEPIDFDAFATALKASGYVFDGSGHALAKDGKLTVKWSPVSGCRDVREGHSCTAGGVAATGNTPNRLNSGLLQFQLLEGEGVAVSVKNVAFVYEPADCTICANSGWAGTFTAAQAPAGQIFLQNSGDVTFEGCTFDKTVLTSWGCTGATKIKNCVFKNVYNSYAAKDVRGQTIEVTGCTFTDCGAGIMVSAANSDTEVSHVTIAGNTFSNVDVAGTAAEGKVGTRGIVQIASGGDYSATQFDFSDNTAENCGSAMRQLNSTVKFDATAKSGLSTLVADGASLYTTDSVKPPVAKIGDTEYASLADALNAAVAANGDCTVEIVDDITFAEGASWETIAIGKNKTLVINGNGKTITGLPQCLFGAMGDSQYGSKFTMTNLKFVKPKASCFAATVKSAAGVILGVAYGMDVTIGNVVIEGADVRGGNDSYVAGFIGWCNGMPGGLSPELAKKTVTLRNCAIRNSTLVSCGSVGGLVAYTTATPNEAVTLVVENCEVTGNTIVGTEIKDGKPRTDIVGAVVGTVGAGGASVAAKVTGNTVYGSTSEFDAETLTKDAEVTTIYGRNASGGTLTLTGGTYDNAPIAENVEWATVAEGFELKQGADGTYAVSEAKYVAQIGEKKYSSLAAAIEAALALNDGTPVEIIDDIIFAEGDTWTPIAYDKGGAHRLVVNGNGHKIGNLPNAMFERAERGYYLRMSSLTFENPVVNSDGDAAVIIGYAESVDELTFTDVAIRGAKVTGGNYAAGFVGYAALDAGNLAATYTRCEVSGSTITGGGSADAIMGHANGAERGSVSVVDCVVKNNAIICTEAGKTQPGKTKAGAVFGTVGASDTFVKAEVSGNTVISGGASIDAGGVAVTTIYGRLGTEGGTLTLTGGTYDYRPFAETDSSWAAVAEGCALAGNDEDGWKVESFIKANGVAYSTLEAAFAAAEPDADGVVTYEIGGKATVDGEGWVQILKSGLTGVKEVKFVGTSDDAEICLVTKGSILADQSYDVNVSFEGLTLTRQNPEYVNDIGFGACYFSTWLRNVNAAENSVTYTRCKFPNGVCNNQYGKTFFNDCTFCNEASGGTTGNNLWVYDGEVEVNGGTFTGNRGVKVYNEGDAKDGISVKIAGATFDGLTEKSAILVSKPSAVTVSDVTVKDCAKGLITRDISGDDEAAVSANGTGISGTFAISSDASAAAAKKEFNLTGGTFTAAVDADYCAKGYEVTANDDGTYGVTSHTVAKVGDNEFNSLAEALKFALNANDGVNFTTVEIVDDITFDEGDTWEPGAFVKVLNKIEVKGVGERKTITGMPGPLFANFDVTGVDPFGSSIRVSNIKFVNTKISETAQGGDEKYGFGSVILGYAYGFKELTVEGVEIENADVRVHGSGDDSCYAAGFFAWCSGDDDGGIEEITIRNCAIRNSTIVSYGTAGGVIGYMSNSSYVKVTIENVEVNGNTIVGTEIKNGAPRTDVIGSVIGSVAPGGASVSATVKDNSVYGTLSAIDAETLTKDTDEVTTIYGRGVGSATTLLITGGEYDNAPFAEADASWAKVAEWSKIVEQDGVYKVVDSPVTLGNVAARQRYPWNGLVDVTFELKSNKSVRLFIVAEYANGDETVRLPMAAAKLVNEDGTQSDVNVSDGSFTVAAQETAKTIHVVWDSTSAVPARQSGVTFKVYAK